MDTVAKYTGITVRPLLSAVLGRTKFWSHKLQIIEVISLRASTQYCQNSDVSASPSHRNREIQNTPGNLRYCKACCTTDEVTAILLSALPFNEMPVETELHALLECTACNDLRDSTPPSLYEAIKPEVWNLFNNDDLTHKLGKLLNRRQTISSIPSNNWTMYWYHIAFVYRLPVDLSALQV